MFVPLKIKTEYSLLKSTIKVDSLILFLKKHNITSCAICDENLYGVMEFFTKMKASNLKPIIGLDLNIDNYEIILYPKDNEGYKNLLKIHTLKETRELTLENIKESLPFLIEPAYLPARSMVFSFLKKATKKSSDIPECLVGLFQFLQKFEQEIEVDRF